jgi:hypothetical protein
MHGSALQGAKYRPNALRVLLYPSKIPASQQVLAGFISRTVAHRYSHTITSTGHAIKAASSGTASFNPENIMNYLFGTQDGRLLR